jgi:hypothetical protein
MHLYSSLVFHEDLEEYLGGSYISGNSPNIYNNSYASFLPNNFIKKLLHDASVSYIHIPRIEKIEGDLKYGYSPHRMQNCSYMLLDIEDRNDTRKSYADENYDRFYTTLLLYTSPLTPLDWVLI